MSIFVSFFIPVFFFPVLLPPQLFLKSSKAVISAGNPGFLHAAIPSSFSQVKSGYWDHPGKRQEGAQNI
ncbi:MAG: hypothetical protein ACMG6H_03770 [Acidobacteriota bacterium]